MINKMEQEIKTTPRGEPLTILMIEDNYDHAELSMRCLMDARVANNIYHVDDGAKALDYLFGRGYYTDRAQFPLPNIILLDLRLPKIDGLQVLRMIKEDQKLRNIPVVVLTTSQEERDMLKAYEYHVNSYLTKPVAFDEFSRMLQDLGFYWIAWNKAPW